MPSPGPAWRRRLPLAGAGLLASAGLLWLLFGLLRAEPDRAAALAAAVPWPLLALAGALEFANIAAGAQKWRVSMRHFRAGGAVPPLGACIVATTLGSLLAQLVPAQLSTPLARALLQRRGTGSGFAFWTTLHEQLFDLIILCAAVAAALPMLVLRAEPALGLATGLLVGIAAVGGSRVALGLGARAAGWGEARAAGGSLAPPMLGRVARAAAEAAALPRGVTAALLGLSLLRLGCMIGRTLLLCAVLVPEVPPAVVALAWPVAQAVTVMPFLPGGFGALEWVWALAFAGGGAPGQAAGEAAVALRLALLGSFAPVAALVLGTALVRRMLPGGAARG